MFGCLKKLFRLAPKQIEVKIIEQSTTEQISGPIGLDGYAMVPYSSLKATFQEAFREANEERIRQEQDLLNDEKLHEYFKLAFLYLASNMNKPSTSGHILLGYNHIKVGSMVGWPTFAQIFIGVCKELNIEANMPCGSEPDDYIFVKYTSLVKAVETLHMPSIDVDERVRAMLYKGPYR